MRIRLLEAGMALVCLLGLSGCSSFPQQYESSKPTGLVLTAVGGLVGKNVNARVNRNTKALCGDNNVEIDITQPSIVGFDTIATKNVILVIKAIKSDPDYEGYGFSYTGLVEGIAETDKYGNVDIQPKTVRWLCYSDSDISKINVQNQGFLESNVLQMNTFGQNDFGKYIGLYLKQQAEKDQK